MLQYMKKRAGEMTDIKALPVMPYAAEGDKWERAAETGERFVQAAALLPKQEGLGWQVTPGVDGRHTSVVLYRGAGNVTLRDIRWIFRTYAAVGDVPMAAADDAACCRVYALQYQPAAKEDDRKKGWEGRVFWVDEYGMGRKKSVQELLDALGEMGGSFCVAAGDGNGGCGRILVALPDEMPLRLRAMLALVFPDTVAVACGQEEEPAATLPFPFLQCAMAGLMETLTPETSGAGQAKPALAGRAQDDGAAAEALPLASGTPIEVLELSLRAYNCLKRAGIESVEQVRALTDEDFSHIRNLGRKQAEEIKQRLAATAMAAEPALTASGYRKMLEELIGLREVKRQIAQIAAYAKLKRDMERTNKIAAPIVMHMAFVGNPGTAKTTVARIAAGIFYEIGLLQEKTMVEVGRADLVARYEGQTAERVRSVFQRAKGKVLFIDEAYALLEHFEGEYGDEAINTIVQEMENNREDTIVIFAGYPNKMEQFIERNPGLRSRVPFRIHFDDYSAEELAQIVERETEKRGFALNAEAREKVASICGAAAHRVDNGNGRFCRNLVEQAILGYASRVYGGQGTEDGQDFVLGRDDFSMPAAWLRSDRGRIGFGA